MNRPMCRWGTELWSLAISELNDFSLRYRDPLDLCPGGGALRASIGRVGLLQPLDVTSEATPRVVAGFRRLEVLASSGWKEVPVYRAPQDLQDPKDQFIAAVEAHVGQAANLREVARAIAVGCRLGMDLAQAAESLLPCFGLQPNAGLAGRYSELLKLPERLLQFCVDKGFSLRRCLPFCRLAPEELQVIDALATWVKGGRQLEEAMSWLSEVAARERTDMAELAREMGLLEATTAGLERLEARRLPETTARRRALEELRRDLAGRGVGIRYDRNFAADQVELLLPTKSLDEVPAHARQLEHKDTLAALGKVLDRALGS